MMRSFRSLLFLFAVMLLRGDFNPPDWKLRRPILGTAAGLAAVKLDRAVYAGSQLNYADIRVVRDGRDIPYVIETRPGAESQERRRAGLLDQGVTTDGIEVTFELGTEARHNRLKLETTRQNFRQVVRVEASPDGKRWAVIRQDGAIFDFTQDGKKLSSLEIDYPESTRRFIRVTVLGWQDPYAITGGSVVHFQKRDAAREVFAEAKPVTENKDRATFATFDLGTPGLPVDRVEFDIKGTAFDRWTELETSHDRQSWIPAGDGFLVRYQGGESLTLVVPERRAQYWRVKILNGDDEPLEVQGGRFLGLVRRLEFEASPSPAMLYYGNSTAPPPAYDLEKRLSRNDPGEAPLPVLTLGPEEPNPSYRPPPVPEKPWTERQPGLLYGVLGLALAVLGFFTWRLLQSMSDSGV